VQEGPSSASLDNQQDEQQSLKEEVDLKRSKYQEKDEYLRLLIRASVVRYLYGDSRIA
jgi:hypothetical protein